MTFIDRVRGEINFKIVYYGPGLAGKTTNIQVMCDKHSTSPRRRPISLSMKTDGTALFDFVPVMEEKVGGLTSRVHLHTVPGSLANDPARAMALKGADGVVFVADSQVARMEANVESLEELESNLAFHGVKASTCPSVFQYNKRDLPTAVPLATMDGLLNPTKREWVDAVAAEGRGVAETFELVWAQVLARAREGGSDVVR